jgi:hypothetical protein
MRRPVTHSARIGAAAQSRSPMPALTFLRSPLRTPRHSRSSAGVARARAVFKRAL